MSIALVSTCDSSPDANVAITIEVFMSDVPSYHIHRSLVEDFSKSHGVKRTNQLFGWSCAPTG